MTKPDHSAVQLAGQVYDASNPGSDVSTEVRLFTKLMMARAIMAEREACALVAEEFLKFAVPVNVDKVTAATIRNRGDAITPAAIRNRSSPPPLAPG